MYTNELTEQNVIDNVLQTSEAAANPEPQVVAPEVPEKKFVPKEDNIQILRRRAEEAERRNQEFERYIQSMQQPQQQQKQAEPDEDDLGIEDDTYVEGKQLKKQIKYLKNEIRQTKKQFEEMNQASTQSSAELRLKSRYTDFDTVVNTDNIRKLAEEKPALYRSIMANPDLYDKGESAYELIKNVLKPDQYVEEDRRIEENAKKPRSSAVAAPQASDSPLARFGDYDRIVLTEERRNEVIKRLNQAKQYR
jgi:hypothetical protein